MAILDELLRKLKSVTLDKTNLDERAVNFAKPRIQNTRQAVAQPLARIQTGIGGVNNPGDSGSALERIKNAFSIDQNNSLPNRFWRGGISNLLVKTQENIQKGNLLTQFKQPDDIVKKNPWMAFTNSSLGYGNTLLKMPTQVGYDLANKRMWQGKENPISDPVNLGRAYTSLSDYRSMNPEQRKQTLSDIFKSAVGSAKPIAVASGLNAPKLVTGMTGLGGLFGYGGAKLEGKKGKEALDASVISAGDQFGRAVTMAGIMRFTNPIGEKLGQLTASKVSALGAPKLAQWLTKKTTEGAFNSAEGVALNPLVDRPLFEDVLVDFFLPGFLDVTGKALRGTADVPIKLLKTAIKDFDLAGLDSAISILKSQGIKVADDAVAEFKKIMASQGGFVDPGEFIPTKNTARSTEELIDLIKSGKGTYDQKSGFVKIKDASGNLINAGRLRKDVANEVLSSLTPEERNLIAIHSGRLEGVLNAGKEGKLAMPSIAVTKKDIPLENFGDTTFVGNRKLVTPNKDMKVYSNDIYSPTIPQPEYDMKGLSTELSKELDARNIYKWDVDSLSKEEFVRRLTEGLPANRDVREQRFYTPEEANKIANDVYGDPVIKLKRDTPSGLTGQLVKSIPGLKRIFDQSTSHYDFRLTAESERPIMIALERYADRKGVDVYEILGNEKDYYEIAPYGSDSLVRKMKEHMNIRNEGKLRGGEQGWGMSAPSRVMSAKEFKSVDDIKKNANLLQPEETVKTTGEAYDQEVTDYLQGLAVKAGLKDPNNIKDIFKEPHHLLTGFDGNKNLVKYALEYIQKNGKLGAEGLRDVVTYNEGGRAGFYSGGEDVLKYVDPKKFEQMIRTAYMDIPTEYFEAKALRAVDFSEFDGIIVPKGELQRVKTELGDKAKGLKIVEYDPKKPNDRMNIIQKHFKDSMFGVIPIVEPQYDEQGNLTGYNFSASKTAMASLAVGGLRDIKKGDLESTMKSFNKLADFKKFGENAKDMIVKEAKALADSVQGVELIPTGQDGRSIRASLNPDWYRRFFASNNRAPNNQELFNLAEENLRTGKVTGEITDPGELKAINEFLDADKVGVPVIKDPLLLGGRKNVPLLEAPQEVITSKKKLLDIFKKTGEIKPFLNELKPRTKPIVASAQQIPTASTGDEARAIRQQYGKMPEMTPQRVTLDEVIKSPGRTVDDRGRRIEEVLYGSATPKREDLGGTKEGAGVFSNLLRSGVGKVSETVGDALSNPNPIVRNTASLLQDLAGNLGKSGDQVVRKSQFSGGIDYATKLGNDAQKYISSLVGNSVESLNKIHSVLDPELSTVKVDYESLTPKEKEATDFLKYVSDFINETNFKNGFITKEKYLENTDGKYIARAYEPYDFPPELADFMEQRNQKLDLDPFKQRTEVTDWKLENAVRDPAYLVAKRLQQTLFNDNFRNMTNWLNTTDMISNTMKPGYVQVSDHKAYGEMAGKFIRKDALEDIKGFFFSNQTAQKAYDMLNWWDKLPARRFRKKMLTVFNPAVRLGNSVGNYVFSWFNGINPVTFASNRSWADKAVKGNDPLYRRAIKDGLLGSDLTRGDIQRFASELKTGTKDAGVLSKIDKVLSDSYGRVDDLAKLSALKTHLDRGFTYDEAFKRVYNGFQNYNAVGFLYDVGAKIPILGNPFVRFKADILRMMKNAVIDHPVRTAGTLLAWSLFTDVMSGISGETQADRETREQRLGAPRVPFTDVSLAIQTPWGELNASRLIGLYAMNQLGESGGTSDVADYLPFEAPALKNIGTDPLLGGALSVAVDTDFRGKKISDPDYSKYTGSLLTDEEKNANKIKYLMRAYNLPTLNDVSDIGSAVKGEPNFYGSKRTPAQSILRTAGLKVEQFGAEEAQLARDKNDMYSMNAVEAEQRKISQIKNQLSRGEIREDEATKRIDAIQSNINKLQSKVSGQDDVAGSTGKAGDIPDTRVKSLNNIFGMNRVTGMPENTNYEKAQKKAEQFAVIDKVLGSDFLSANEQESYLSQVTGFKKEEIGYYRVAKGGTDERYGFVLDKIEAQDSDLMSTLATMRYEIDEKKILTNNLVDRLEDEGYLTDAQAKMLKKIEYNQSTGKIGVSGSGSAGNKVAKAIAKMNSDNSQDLRELFQQLSKTSSATKGSARSLIDFSRKANSITTPNSRSISDVLSSKRAIQPIAKIG